MRAKERQIVYDLDYLVKMLPYVRSFCQSFIDYTSDLTQILSDNNLSRSDLESMTVLKNLKRNNWLMDMRKLGFKVCNEAAGHIDVPLQHPHSQELIFACVGPDTKEELDILCHRLAEKNGDRRGIWKI